MEHYRTYSTSRNILCFPISDNDEVIGVAELCNKQSGSHFTKFDEEMAMAFRFVTGSKRQNISNLK